MFLMYVFSIDYAGNSDWVTFDPQKVTYSNKAKWNENADVLLAQEEYAGVTFYELKTDDLIQVGYPDGMRLYKVTELQRYTATVPKSVYSGFIGEDGVTLSSAALVKKLYVPGKLVLQTCYDDSRGRLFVIAERIRIDGGRKLGR